MSPDMKSEGEWGKNWREKLLDNDTFFSMTNTEMEEP